MTLKSVFCPLISCVFFLSSCANDVLDVDASDVNVDIDFLNMDSILVHSDSAQFMKYHTRWKSEIKDFYAYQIAHCLGIRTEEDTTVLRAIHEFVSDPYISRLEKRMGEKYKDLSDEKETLIDGFKHLKYHFPEGKIPKNIVFMNSFFAISGSSPEMDLGASAHGTELGIGLERYLGPTTDVIRELPPMDFYQWMKDEMKPAYLERDALATWIDVHYVDEPRGESLIEHMIYWGKVLYLVEASYPDAAKRIVLRYSEDEYQWALDNEAFFWGYLVDQKMLFKLDERTKTNLLRSGPFTPGLPENGENSPDRLGQFLGWRMVHQYMEEMEISVSEMIAKDYKEIYQSYNIEEE